jgi:hypothetical protein
LTEAEARAALRAFEAAADIEQWIAEQWWEPTPRGWRVRGRLHDWTFEVEPVSGGVRVIMHGPGEQPADWIVPPGTP